VQGGFSPLRRVFRHVTALDQRPHRVEPSRRLGDARLLAVALSDDTSLLKRASLAARERLRGEAHALWARGGVLDPRNRRDLVRLEAHTVRRGMSASAAGDLTAAVILFEKTCREGLAAP
jgi:triphosphoribosyl-dephospho-CoA synthetase